MKRPYRYELAYDWSGDCLREGHKGYRTSQEGTRQEFLNNVFDGKDPRPVIEAEQAGYKLMNRPESKSVGKLVIIITGDQTKE